MFMTRTVGLAALLAAFTFGPGIGISKERPHEKTRTPAPHAAAPATAAPSRAHAARSPGAARAFVPRPERAASQPRAAMHTRGFAPRPGAVSVTQRATQRVTTQAAAPRLQTRRVSRPENARSLARRTVTRSSIAETNRRIVTSDSVVLSSTSRAERLGRRGSSLANRVDGHRRGYFRGGIFGGRFLSSGYYPDGYWGGGQFMGDYYDPGYYPTDMIYDDGFLGAPVVPVLDPQYQNLSQQEHLAMQGLPRLSDAEIETAERWAEYRERHPQEYTRIAEDDPRVRLLMERFDATEDGD